MKMAFITVISDMADQAPKHLVKLEDGVHKEKGGQFRITMKPQDTNDEVLIEKNERRQLSSNPSFFPSSCTGRRF